MLIKSKVKNYHVHFEKELILEYDFYIIDKNVYRLHKSKFKLNSNKLLLVDANECSKTYLKCHDYLQKLIELGVKRGQTICAIGGGIIQDIAGFITSILYRGVDWVFYPTTLLAQCDSCIGGKTSINFGAYKNLVGNFNPPVQIFVNLEFLETLDHRDIMSGIGEIIKVAFLDNFTSIKTSELQNAITNGNVERNLIDKALQIKKRFIEVDEFDKGVRNLMNYGHTFGHAIETITKHQVPHGIAVGLGIYIANQVSKKLLNIKFKNQDEGIINLFVEKNNQHWQRFKSEFNASDYLNILMKDKKNVNLKEICCILKINNDTFSKKNIDKNVLTNCLSEIMR